MTLDDQELRSALALLAEDSDPSADIAATVRTRLRRRDRLRRNLAVCSLAAAVIATLTVASSLAIPGRTTQVVPVGASASATAVEATPPASSGAAPDGSTDSAGPGPAEGADQVSFRCLATADVSDRNARNYVSISLQGGSDTGSQAVSSCTRLWVEGTLSTTTPYVRDQPTNPADPVVPELVACLLSLQDSDYLPEAPRQEVAVLPGGPEVCGQLGLDVPAG